jgi:hypothetical protein
MSGSQGTAPEPTMRVRVLFGLLEGEDRPVVAGSIDQTIWDLIPPEDWDAQALSMKQACVGDWAVYDWREIVVEIPVGLVLKQFMTDVIEGVVRDAG